MEHGIHIALAPEVIGHIGPIPITNTLLMSWIVMLILAVFAVLVGRNLKLVPGRLQALAETGISFVYDYVSETLENKVFARRFFPLLMTIFLFIVVANLIEFTPGIGSLVIAGEHGESVPLLRSMNTDLNVTLALAIIAVIAVEIAGIIALGFFKYAGKFITFRGSSISQRILNFAVGLIELVSELSRFISFSFRLFGNIFAGEVLIAVVSFFMPYIVPVPFMAFETFIGFIQAVVFALLTLFFIKLAITDPHEAH